MTTPLDPGSSIFVVGGGTWGCSTALHLLRRGYNNVTIFDPFPTPSAISAGNDINKVLEAGSFAEGEDEAVAAGIMLSAAHQGWTKDPVFTPFFHDVGYVLAASSPDAIETVRNREIRHSPDLFRELNTAEDFRDSMPQGVLTGQFPGWKGWHRKSGVGWVHARKAMVAAAREATRLGARFIVGNPRGLVEKLIYDKDDVIGLVTADGCEHFAARVIVAAGAHATSILDFENQLRPTAWTVAHIAMSPGEAKLYKNIPVIFHSEKGFFIEPDEDRNELKVCDEHPGYCNWVLPKDNDCKYVFPQSFPVPTNRIPASSAKRIREFLEETAPQLASRPFTHTATLWCADTPNRAFLITAHPRHPSLILAAGDSGHGFTHLPSIGGFVVDVMEDTLDPRLAKSWRWRPETARDFWGHDLLGRSGAGNQILDLKETIEEGWVQGSEDGVIGRPAKL